MRRFSRRAVPVARAFRASRGHGAARNRAIARVGAARALAATLALAAALAFAAEPAPARAEVPEFVREADWLDLRTTHFAVITDAGPRVGWDVAHKLERFSRALGRLNPGLRAVSSLPTTVYVFRDQSELDRYRPARAENLVAFFTPTEDRNLLVVNGAPQGMARSEVIFHEFVHCYLSANYPEVPMWLNEGLAEYYSTCRMTGRTAEFGTPEMNIVRWMKGRPPISLELMFAMRPNAPAYQRDNALRNQFYAESFALTHYLQSPGGGRAERFDRFLDHLHSGAQPMRAFREIFPDTEWVTMVGALDEYLGRIDFEPTRKVDLPVLTDDDQGALALSPAEALTRLGELQMHLGEGRAVVAAEHFDAALALDPGFAPARAGLGVAADRDGREADAEAHYARALTTAPADPRVLDAAGRGTMFRLYLRLKADAPHESLQATARLARARFARSLQADPDDLEALGGYGQSFAMVGDPADSSAVRGLERAVAALPGRSDLAVALLVLKAQEELTEPRRPR